MPVSIYALLPLVRQRPSLDQCSVVCRPISDVVFCLVLRVHSRLHVEIIHLPSLRWPGGRSWRTEGAGSVHQRTNAMAPLGDVGGWSCDRCRASFTSIFSRLKPLRLRDRARRLHRSSWSLGGGVPRTWARAIAMAHRSDRRGDTPTTGAGQTGPYQRLASPRAFTIVARSRACSLEGPKIRLQSDAVPPRRMRVEGDRNPRLLKIVRVSLEPFFAKLEHHHATGFSR